MGRPSKAVTVATGHRTKAELAVRADGEKSLLSGRRMKESPEVRADKTAHAEFLRVAKLLTSIGKNEALYESIINRYCLLRSECLEFERLRGVFSSGVDRLDEEENMDAEKKYKLLAQMQKSLLDADKQVQAKRRMMFEIEKECAMTVASALRAVPKTPSKTENPLLEVLRHGTA